MWLASLMEYRQGMNSCVVWYDLFVCVMWFIRVRSAGKGLQTGASRANVSIESFAAQARALTTLAGICIL